VPLRDPAIDHAVVNVRDQMDRAVEIYRRLGFYMTERGYHTLGSINHLAVLEQDYIELIGFEPNAVNVRTDILRYPCGLNALVFGMSEANSVYAELQNSDVPAEPPIAFSRPVAVDGSNQDARFQTVRLAKDAVAGGRVYFCQHLTPELVWRPEWQRHANGAVALARAVLVSADPARAVAIFRRMFGNLVVSTDRNGAIISCKRFRIEIVPPDGLAGSLGCNTPEADGRSDYMAAMSVRTQSLDKAQAALSAGSIKHTRFADGRVVVPASETMNVTIEFVLS
jgi:Glyoxalase-like domain